MTEIAPSLAGYSPRLYRGFTITHERDGYWRVYLGTVQQGWARRLKDARGIVDRLCIDALNYTLGAGPAQQWREIRRRREGTSHG